MAALSLGGALGIGGLLLFVQAISVALGRALRTYSRSRLEVVCLTRRKPDRAGLIERDDEATERAAEGIAVVVELVAAAWVARELHIGSPLLTIVIAASVTILNHFLASVIGRVWAETYLAAVWPIAGFIRQVAWPLTSIALAAEWLANHLAGPADSPPRPASVEVEILPDIDHPEDVESDVSLSTRALLEHVVGLTRLDVSEIMTPRSSMISLPSTVSPKVAAQTFRDSGLSRIPIFGENRDDIVGILYAKDLFPLMIDRNLDDEPLVPRKLARPAYFVPETQNANDLLGELRARRSQIAIVLDEYGGVAGLATLEDLFEELVGPIDDEHDVPTPNDLIRPVGATKFEVDATVPIGQINHRFRLHLPTDEAFQTVGGYAFNELGRLPNPGEMFQADGVQITILEVVERSIRRVLMELNATDG